MVRYLGLDVHMKINNELINPNKPIKIIINTNNIVVYLNQINNNNYYTANNYSGETTMTIFTHSSSRILRKIIYINTKHSTRYYITIYDPYSQRVCKKDFVTYELLRNDN